MNDYQAMLNAMQARMQQRVNDLNAEVIGELRTMISILFERTISLEKRIVELEGGDAAELARLDELVAGWRALPRRGAGSQGSP